MRVLAIPTKRGIVPAIVVFALTAVLIATITGCGSNEAEANQKAAEPTATAIVIQVTQAPTATVDPTPAPSPTSTAPEKNLSDDEQVLLEMHRVWSEAHINLDTEHFHDGCDPELAKTVTLTAEELIDEWTKAISRGGLTPQEFGTGEPSVVVMGGTNAIVQFAILKNGEEKFAWAEFYTKHGDTWFEDCTVLN